MNEQKRGRGRPKMTEGEARDNIFWIRPSSAKLALIKEAAEKAGVNSDWARDVLLSAVEQRK